jgi:mannose-6-phosphate isomerase-like protein (cupin superfamily)
MNISIDNLNKDEVLICPFEVFGNFSFFDNSCRIDIHLTNGAEVALGADAGHCVFVYEGEFVIALDDREYRLDAFCFGQFSGRLRLNGHGRAVVLSRAGHQSATLFGGPVEEVGRLRYVDGCTASLLLPPSVRGEPCLNFMHLPRQTTQTMHTHPSLRVGIVLSGRGACNTESQALEFLPGTVFFIPPNVPHSFRSQEDALRVVIYHPDSDSGPTHADHTMLNRTLIGGQSARLLPGIHTQIGAEQ